MGPLRCARRVGVAVRGHRRRTALRWPRRTARTNRVGRCGTARYGPAAAGCRGEVWLDPNDGGGLRISSSELTATGVVPGPEQAGFQEAADQAEQACSISTPYATAFRSQSERAWSRSCGSLPTEDASSLPSTMGAPTLRGRRGECDALVRLLDAARAGNSSIVVLRGEAGSGKTALLDFLLERASDFRIARILGVESEMELAFAGLHQLCAPMLDRVEHLPAPQRDALRRGIRAGRRRCSEQVSARSRRPDSAGRPADAHPFACLIDDAQWLDRASVQVLAFVARRAVADRLALVFSVREPSEERELVGLPELAISPLADSDARLVLGAAIRGRLDDRVRDRIIAEARGNPLALVELPLGSTAAELAGGFGLPSASAVVQPYRGQLPPTSPGAS